jgi:hypothetical protein
VLDRRSFGENTRIEMFSLRQNIEINSTFGTAEIWYSLPARDGSCWLAGAVLDGQVLRGKQVPHRLDLLPGAAILQDIRVARDRPGCPIGSGNPDIVDQGHDSASRRYDFAGQGTTRP